MSQTSLSIFGLTGGIASGKSTVAARFRSRGVPVIDADDVARAVVEKGTPGLAALIEAFGATILNDDGTLHRKTLGQLVFASEEARTTVNRITHPLVAAETFARTEALAAAGHTIACYEAALLVELGLVEAFRPLVVVDVPEFLQLSRLMERDGLSEDEAKGRVGAQAKASARRAAADFLITNVGSLDELLGDADATLDAVCTRLSVPRRPSVTDCLR